MSWDNIVNALREKYDLAVEAVEVWKRQRTQGRGHQ